MRRKYKRFNGTVQKWKAKLPNVVHAKDTKYFLDNREVTIYIYLQFMSAVGDDENTVTSHVDYLDAHLPFMKNKRQNRDKVKQIIQSLADKNYITVEGNKMLDITINDKMKDEACVVDVDFKENAMTFKGYTELTVDDYNRACSFTNEDSVAFANGMKVFAYVKWRQNARFEYRISQKEWAVALDKSERQAFDIVDECVSAGLIGKVSGGYKANGQQETNLYTIPTTFDVEMNEAVSAEEDDDDVPGGVPEMDIEKEMNIHTNNGIELQQIQTEDSRVTGEVYKKFKYKPETADDNLTVDDYHVWKVTTSRTLKEVGESKFESIRNGDYIKSKLEAEHRQKYDDSLEKHEVETVKEDKLKTDRNNMKDIFDDGIDYEEGFDLEDVLDDEDVFDDVLTSDDEEQAKEESDDDIDILDSEDAETSLKIHLKLIYRERMSQLMESGVKYG